MKIRLRLFATLQEFLPPGTVGTETIVDLPESATIPDALGALSVPMNLTHIVFVNGRHVLRPDRATYQLKDGDILGAFPPIGGG